MDTLKVLGICGSLRKDSYNLKLLRIAEGFAREDGAQVTEADLKQLALPLYDGDLESAGFPESVERFKTDVAACDVLLLASPEYNYSIPGPLKNAIDWASRGGNAFKGKTAAVFGASTGPYGTVRAQQQLRQCLACVNVLVLPQPQVMVPDAQAAFDGDGLLNDEKRAGLLRKLVQQTLAAARRIAR